MKNFALSQYFCGLFALFFVSALSAQTYSPQSLKKEALSCATSISFETQTSQIEYLQVKRSVLKNKHKNTVKKGAMQLCIDRRGNYTSTSKGAFPSSLLEINEFVHALRQSAGNLRSDFSPLLDKAKEQGAIVERLNNGTVTIKHRIRGGGQWLTLIDMRRNMLLGCSEYDYQQNLVKKMICSYHTDGRRPPQINYVTLQEFSQKGGMKETYVVETVTYFSAPEVLINKPIKNASTRRYNLMN